MEESEKASSHQESNPEHLAAQAGCISQVSWVPFLVAAGLFTFLYCTLLIFSILLTVKENFYVLR